MKIREKIIILISIVTIFIATIIYFIIMPTISDIKAINHAVYLERIDLEIKYQRGQLLNKVLDDFEKIKSEETRFKNVFISAGQELEFIRSLEAIAESYDIIQDLQLLEGDDDKKNVYKTTYLIIEAVGEFTKILNYLEEINALNHYYNIDTVTMTSDKTQDGDVSLKIKGGIFIIN